MPLVFIGGGILFFAIDLKQGRLKKLGYLATFHSSLNVVLSLAMLGLNVESYLERDSTTGYSHFPFLWLLEFLLMISLVVDWRRRKRNVFRFTVLVASYPCVYIALFRPPLFEIIKMLGSVFEL